MNLNKLKVHFRALHFIYYLLRMMELDFWQTGNREN